MTLSTAHLKRELARLIREYATTARQAKRLVQTLRTHEGSPLLWHDPTDVLLAVVTLEHELQEHR